MGAIDRINKKIKRIQQEEEVKAGKKTSLEASMSNIEDFRNELKTNGKIDYADTSTIIAPYKTSTKNSSKEETPWYKKVFTKGEFADGYDFGDWTKTMLGTATEINKNITKGAASVFEAPLDIGTNLVASGLNAVGLDKASKATRKFADKDLSNLVANSVANVSNVGKMYNIVSGNGNNIHNPSGISFDKDKSFGENVKSIPSQYFSSDKKTNAYEKSSLSGQYADKTTELVGYTLGIMFGTKGLENAFKGGSVGINTAKGTTAVGAGFTGGNVTTTIAGKTLKLPTLAITGGMSSGLSEANSKENVTEAERWTKALSSGAIEGVTEGIFGMFGVGGNELTDKLGEQAAKKFTSSAGKMLAKIGVASTGEAAEEFLSYAGNYLVDNNIIDKMGKADFSQKWDWGEVGEQMALAYVSSLITQGGGTVIENNSAIAKAEKELGRKLTDKEKAQVTQTVIEGTAEEKFNNISNENQINNTTTQEEHTNSLVEAPSNTLNNGNKLSEAFIEEIKNKTIEANKDKANVEYVSTEELLPYQKRGGYRTSEEVTKLEDNIKENGITSPIELIKKSNGEIEIANGTHRLDIANKLGLKQIPVTYVNSNMENIANSNEVLYNNENQEDLDYYEGEYNGSIRNSEVAIKNNDRSRVEEGNRVTNNIASENEGTTRGNDRVLTEVQGHNDGSSSNTTYKQNTKQELDNSSFFNEKNKTKDNTGKNVSEEKQEALKDSKVRDENGNLIRMYHGSPNGTYEKLKGGTYFTEDYNYAERYKNPGASSISYGKSENNPKVYEAYLDIKKPFDINDSEARDIYINEYVKGGNAMGINPYLTDAEYNKIDNIDWTEVEDLKTFLEENGYDYDGIVSYEGADGGYGQEVVDRGKSYIPFNEDQIINAEENAQNNENTVQNSIPTKEELDNLENVRQNKSGSDYANAFYDLENKYGKANLYKGINEYNSNAKNNVVSNETTQNIQEDIAPIKEAAEDLKEAQKEVVAQVKELQKEIKSIKTTIEDVKALTEEDLPAIETQASENFKNIREEDIPPIMENTTPEVEEEISPTKSLTDIRDYEEVGSKKVNAYQYDNPEVKPYFQDAAIGMLNDLEMSTKGERFIIGDASQFGNGDYVYSGTKRNTTSDIAELLDGMDGKYQYSYDEIKKGLNAIIEDHGAENIAVAKRIEFFLDERLRNGYTTLDGYDIPANQEYLNTLREKEYADYYSSLPINENAPMEVEEEIAPTKEIAPVKEKYEAIEPRKEPKMIRVKPDRAAFNENVERTAQEVKNELGYIPKDPTRAESYDEEIAKIISEEPKTESQKKKRTWAILKANIFDKGAVFEDVSIKNKNRDLMGKWDYTLTSEARAQNVIGNGHTEYNADTKETVKTSKSLNEIKAEVDNTGLTKEFYEYMYHKHNVDRMNLADRYEGMENKPVFGNSITSDVSQEIVNQYEFSNPEFMDFAEDVYDYVAADRQQLVKEGVISQETADLWNEMYPHYVPIRRSTDSGLNVDVPLATNRTGINAPIKKATGGNSDILPLFDTMAQRTMQTYKATAKNSFGVELKNTLGTSIESNQTNVDEIIDSVDNQEGLLQEGKNGANPTFTVFENGERTTFEITQDMYDALAPLSDSSLLSKTFTPLNKASNFHRGVLTEYNPVFMLTNSIKDIQDVLINSQHAAKTYSKIPEAYSQLINKGYWYQEYMANGGEQNSYFDSQENTFKTENKGLAKVLDHGPLKWISQMNNFVEMSPRLAEYIASREAGRSIEVSMLDAARVTTNFKAGGNLTKFANRNGATFLNASVQGAMQQVRNIREANMNGAKGWVNLATKFAIAGLPAILLNGLVWKDDDDYEELSDYVKQNYYIVGKYGDGQFIRIPKGRTLAVIQNGIEQVQKASSGDDEADLNEFIKLVLNNLAPNNPVENNILSPFIQVANNKTWYGEDLVPSRLQDLPAKEQYDESIDSFSKWLGEKTNISPYKINYLLDQYTGGVGDVLLPMGTPEATSGNDSLGGQILAPFTKKFTTDSTMNNKNVGNFYEKSEELTTGAKKSDAKDEDVLKNKFINSVKAEMNEFYKQKREIQNDSSLSKSEKYEQVREIQKKINDLAKAGLNNYEDLSVSSNYATVSDASYRKNTKDEWVKVSDDEEKELNELNMTDSDKNTYFKTKNNISEIEKEYKDNKDSSSEKKSSIINSISNSGLNDKQQAYLYKKYYNTDTIDTVINSEIGVSTYFDYVQQEFKADYNSNGKVISGSRKDKVINYINQYDLTIPQKAILIKSTNTFKFNDYNEDIISYVDGLSLDYETKKKLLKDLDMEADADGTVRW